MKRIVAILLLIGTIYLANAQPGNGNGGGNGNGNGNGGNGNNGNGNGGCGNPPCGGPHVPIDAEWLVFAGLIAGFYLKLRGKRIRP